MPSVLVLNEAVVTPPLLLTLTAPPALLPSMVNCTVPVGVPAPGAVTAMVAVKVTFCPETPGFGDAADHRARVRFVHRLAGRATAGGEVAIPGIGGRDGVTAHRKA